MCTYGTVSQSLPDPLTEMIFGELSFLLMVLLKKELWPFNVILDGRPLVCITLN